MTATDLDSGARDASMNPSEPSMRVAPVPTVLARHHPAWRCPTSRLLARPALLAGPACLGGRNRLAHLVVALFSLGVLATPALAERADRELPTNVESDRMHYDEPKQTTVFSGRVVLTKGSLIIRGDEMVLRQVADNQQLATATGKPATFRQKRDGPGEQYINGTGLTIDYDSRNEKMVLIGSAVMTRTECGRTMDQVTGARIVYDGLTETFTVDGKPSTGQAQSPSGRVRLTIQPRPDGKSSSAPAPCPGGEPARLQPDTGIAEPRPDTPGVTGR